MNGKQTDNFNTEQIEQNEFVSKARDVLNKGGVGFVMDATQDSDNDEMLNVPLIEALDIQFHSIWVKIKAFFNPFNLDTTDSDLHKPDFWGPLFIVILYSLTIVWGQLKVLSWVSLIWIFGSVMVFFFGRVLGHEVFFGQVLGIVGYGFLPLEIVALIMIPLSNVQSGFKIIIQTLGVLWSSYTIASCLVSEQALLDASGNYRKGRKIMYVYPIFLTFAFVMSMQSGV
eukprot:TRINITY_DN1381_c0_g1_i1.p1 TRINITY_DN1381_c0_g1~~TRINITY_DN1381_c0_g1_i1.p1  ORF type:complete len:266 (+),score=61.24 TRINITY_DN1381_c0_g1_i1:116-799(+)